MSEILCHKCGHSINEHSTACRHHDVINPATWNYCKCEQSAQDIAAHVIKAMFGLIEDEPASIQTAAVYGELDLTDQDYLDLKRTQEDARF